MREGSQPASQQEVRKVFDYFRVESQGQSSFVQLLRGTWFLFHQCCFLFHETDGPIDMFRVRL